MPTKQHILVIDDDVQMVDTVETLLTSVGYEVSHSYLALDGIELAREIKPDLILLDVMFAGPPGPDGFAIARQLKDDADLKDIPIIIVSGLKKVLDISYDMAPDDKWMPVKAFLEKPIKPAEVLGAIEKVLGARQA
jgi:CheY-like chemotaxis protein